MHDALPTIGVTLDLASSTPEAYSEAVAFHGARVQKLPPDLHPLPPLEGLLLVGGGDIEPHWYGESPHPHLGRLEPERDRMEITFAREAIARGIPVLGICRGAQVIGVALGGKLVGVLNEGEGLLRQVLVNLGEELLRLYRRLIANANHTSV